jgi:gamma-glutamylcysteine synthetase
MLRDASYRCGSGDFYIDFRRRILSCRTTTGVKEIIMKKLLVICAAASCLGMVQVHAQVNTTPSAATDPAMAEFKAARDKISADYKADKAACDAMKDNAKDVCMEQAKGKEKIAKAELDQKQKPSDGNARKVAEAKVEVAYEVAKEKCDDQKGDAKDACVKQAKADQEKGKAEIKAMKK